LPACAEEPAPPTTNPTTEPTQPTEPTEPTGPQPVDAAEFSDQIEITSLTDDTFGEILESAASFLEENPLISVPINTYTLSFAQGFIDPENYILSEETNSIVLNAAEATHNGDVTKGKQKIQYLLMLYCLSEKYVDCIILGNDEYSHNTGASHDMMCIYPGFPTSGHTDFPEYIGEYSVGRIPDQEDAYYIHFCHFFVANVRTHRYFNLFPKKE
jgi:hypothetical protein